MQRSFGTCDQQYFLLWEALILNGGTCKQCRSLDFYRLIEMSLEDVDSLEVTITVKVKFLLLVDTRHSSETLQGCILFVKSRSIGLMAWFGFSGGKTTTRT
jgi:hypothetical protein